MRGKAFLVQSLGQRPTTVLGPLVAVVATGLLVAGLADETASVVVRAQSAHEVGPPVPAELPEAAAGTMQAVAGQAQARYDADVAAFRIHRPAYPFWQHIFTIPDGSIVYGSGTDGHLLATFPQRGNWARDGEWVDPAHANVLQGQSLPRRLGDRRDRVAELLEPVVGDVLHNPTRGRFLAPHATRHGDFLKEWGRIYERFGVPAEIGLAQAMVESGLNGRARSRVRALGFCQWMPRNWSLLKRLSPYVIEGYNQTTQAPFCAAYLSILATMYGSFIPALSEHHAGGVNVGRTMINGERLGANDKREQYLRGSDFAKALRQISIRRYRQLFRTYGPRSALYAEMVFGNVYNVRRLILEMPQSRVYAMRAPRNLAIGAISDVTGLSRDELKRYNPALVRQVPRGANVYLPMYVEEFGPDVSFWHRPPTPEYAAVLDEFLGIEAPLEDWHTRAFAERLREFAARFAETGTEEGTVMSTMIRFTIDSLINNRRGAILTEFRSSDRIQGLFERGRQELAAQGGS
ncbi:MAG: lytic transglycosylase domain-containing protein [Acidobacteria bacterium]|nr:lytic transglycosylase domain-containing protein [Acidobacteriota bacterium]MYJ03839.1 lytic transglycosylase domain-containing protein [Acidobacteriota bacterium]